MFTVSSGKIRVQRKCFITLQALQRTTNSAL